LSAELRDGLRVVPSEQPTGDAMFEGSDPKATLSSGLQKKIAIAVALIVMGVVALNASSGFRFGNWDDQQQRSEINRATRPL
jgi:hypothetical protein